MSSGGSGNGGSERDIGSEDTASSGEQPPADDELDDALLALLEKLRSRCSDRADFSADCVMQRPGSSCLACARASARCMQPLNAHARRLSCVTVLCLRLHAAAVCSAARRGSDGDSDDVVIDGGEGLSSDEGGDNEDGSESDSGKQGRADAAGAAAAVPGAGGVPKPAAPQPQQSRHERLAAKRRQKLEKLLKRGKRIGQRMRRQLYEKLYGYEANHLKVR